MEWNTAKGITFLCQRLLLDIMFNAYTVYKSKRLLHIMLETFLGINIFQKIVRDQIVTFGGPVNNYFVNTDFLKCNIVF